MHKARKVHQVLQVQLVLLDQQVQQVLLVQSV
jgi:hypothetical protein